MSTPFAADEAAARTLTCMVRAMFPHAAVPDGPYERTAAAILADAAGDVRLRAQLDQGLRDLDQAGFEALDGDARLAHLRAISASPFFESIRAKVVTTLYDDHEVWERLGYEGPSFDRGGYLERGFADLDWLPEPRIEEPSR